MNSRNRILNSFFALVIVTLSAGFLQASGTSDLDRAEARAGEIIVLGNGIEVLMNTCSQSISATERAQLTSLFVVLDQKVTELKELVARSGNRNLEAQVIDLETVRNGMRGRITAMLNMSPSASGFNSLKSQTETDAESVARKGGGIRVEIQNIRNN